jgi:hypothetical protein
MEFTVEHIFTEAVKKTPEAIKFIKTQTPEMCLIAVMHDGLLLEHVIIQTEEICLAALKQNPDAFKFVRIQTPIICIAAVQGDGMNLFHVNLPINNKDQTINKIKETWNDVLHKNWGVFNKIKEQTHYAITDVVHNHGKKIGIANNQTLQICIEAVKQNGLALQFVAHEFRTTEVCHIAVDQNALALKYAPNQTNDMCLSAVKRNGITLQWVNTQTLNMCIESIQQDGRNIRYVRNKTPEMCIEALKQTGLAAEFITEDDLRFFG